MNIILTGEQRVGKTTALNRALAGLESKSFGFLTRFDSPHSSPEKRLYLLSLDGARRECAVRWHGGKPEVCTQVFDSLGAELLAESGELCVIDELGKFEADALALRDAVHRVFDSDTPVLAVVRLSAAGCMLKLRERPDVRVLTVTEANRDGIPETINTLLGGSSLRWRAR